MVTSGGLLNDKKQMCILDCVLILYSEYLPALSHVKFSKYSHTRKEKFSVVLLASVLVKYLSKKVGSVLLQLSRNFEIIAVYVSANFQARWILGEAG